MKEIEIGMKRILERFNPGERAGQDDKKLILFVKAEISQTLKEIENTFGWSKSPIQPSTHGRVESGFPLWEKLDNSLKSLSSNWKDICKNPDQNSFNIIHQTLGFILYYIIFLFYLIQRVIGAISN